jgi:hypothetical protein
MEDVNLRIRHGHVPIPSVMEERGRLSLMYGKSISQHRDMCCPAGAVREPQDKIGYQQLTQVC